ncbi:hypothetical protein AAFF_G00132050 [Aldrovandia affinis]|uniref:Matrin-type domain-containing protein n=1 Tax=Aldrovandia affinis TaxID=143900 RepID=A0AAD7RR49_9TELE|nr:hypothetical protein AAFF_G00132050 [Aldrovandia affinis]
MFNDLGCRYECYQRNQMEMNGKACGFTYYYNNYEQAANELEAGRGAARDIATVLRACVNGSRIHYKRSTHLAPSMEYTVSFQVHQQLTVFPAHLDESQMKSSEVQAGPIHRQLLQSVQCPAHLAVPEARPLPESETREQSEAVLHAASHGWRLSCQETAHGQRQDPCQETEAAVWGLTCHLYWHRSATQSGAAAVGRVPAALPWQRQDSDRYCQLCDAWFNNRGMAQQHYEGKKHKKNSGRADLLEHLGQTLGVGETKGLKRSHTCEVCSVTLNSVAQYHAHLQGSKHQNNLKNQL